MLDYWCAFTNAAAKGTFVIIWHFWGQDVRHVKMPSASSQSCQAVRRKLGRVKMSCFDV